MRASERKARQGRFQVLNNSPGTISQGPITDKSGITEEQLPEKTQQRECKIAGKVKDEIGKTENKLLKALGSLS